GSRRRRTPLRTRSAFHQPPAPPQICTLSLHDALPICSLRDAGALLALSSDWTVSTLNPFEIIETAITRQPPRKEGDHPVFIPEERLTLAECVEGYTVNAATAGWRQTATGSLSPGKWADLILLDRDIYACSPYDIGDTRVLLTLLAGREVWSA